MGAGNCGTDCASKRVVPGAGAPASAGDGGAASGKAGSLGDWAETRAAAAKAPIAQTARLRDNPACGAGPRRAPKSA